MNSAAERRGGNLGNTRKESHLPVAKELHPHSYNFFQQPFSSSSTKNGGVGIKRTLGT